jgi:transcription elongation GreA/GreB family factor
MHHDDLINIKHAIQEKILKKIQEKLDELRHALFDTQRSANEETKSSAGDKYETGRAMAHLEIEKLALQIREKELAIQALTKIPTDRITKHVEVGSVVQTSAGLFYLSVQAGEIEVNGDRYTTLSLLSPLGKNLFNKVKGDAFSMNGQSIEIIEVY